MTSENYITLRGHGNSGPRGGPRGDVLVVLEVEDVDQLLGLAELVVADDGVGLRGAAEGSGIHGMRERAHLVDGRFEIGPRPGGGTQVRLVVPLRAPS